MKFSVLVEVINLGESRNSLTFGDTYKKNFVNISLNQKQRAKCFYTIYTRTSSSDKSMTNYTIKELKLNRGKIKFNSFNVYKLD